jgi:hypothetical protein
MKRIGNFESLKIAGVDVSGGVDPSYVDSTIVDTVVSSIDTWTDVSGASVVVSPSGSQKWEIVGEFDLYIFHNDGTQVYANARIVDSSNNVIDNAIRLVSHRAYTASTASMFSVFMIARDTISASKTYKLQIRKGTNGSSVSIYNGNITGDISGDDSKPKFYAKRVF